MTSLNKDSHILINMKNIEKDLRGLIYEIVNAELKKFNIIDHIDKYISDYIRKHGERIVKKYVYSFMEESEIVVPDRWPEKKIALNTFVIQIVREVVEHRVKEELKKIKITITENNEEESKN